MSEKTIEELGMRVQLLEEHVSDNKNIGKDFQEKMNLHMHGCGLDGYKKEMKQRCETLNERISRNKETSTRDKTDLEKLVDNTSAGCCKKIDSNRTLIWRTISTLILLGVCFIGVIGTIQIQKVSIQEYNNHLEENAIHRVESQLRFDKFLSTYETNRDKRDGKLDTMLNRQLDFNDRILQQNALLEKQLEVIKTRVDFSKGK
jgi:hypothetical protein